MATRRGRSKRIAMSELSSVRPSGVIAINLDEGDQLGWARLTNGNDDVILITEQGQALRFSEKEIRSMGRTAAGVRAIRLGKQDYVTSMEVIEPDGYLLVVTRNGFGKRTLLSGYPVKGRATRGVATINKAALTTIGPVVSARVVQEDDDLTIISANGVVLRTKVKDVSASGRGARGVTLLKPDPGDFVASMARISNAELRQAGAAE